jgi:hypothetical protein
VFDLHHVTALGYAETARRILNTPDTRYPRPS